MVAVKPIAEAIGVDWKSQHAKLIKDPRFNYGDITIVANDGKNRTMLALPVRQLNGWLYGINANKVKPELREKLLQFQEECHLALHNHFSGRANDQAVAFLKQLVEQLQEQVAGLLAKQDEAASRHAVYDQMLGLEVSAAGRRLAAARHLHSIH